MLQKYFYLFVVIAIILQIEIMFVFFSSMKLHSNNLSIWSAQMDINESLIRNCNEI